MAQQLDLLERKKSINEEAEEFHRRNPDVLKTIKEMSLDMFQRGWRKYAIATLWESLRHNKNKQTSDPNSEFKLNNNYRAWYARKVMADVPCLKGFFSIREQRTGDVGSF